MSKILVSDEDEGKGVVPHIEDYSLLGKESSNTH